MGKNRNVSQQVVKNHAELGLNNPPELVSRQLAEDDFLTSDDFQVVQRKRHAKKSPDVHPDDSNAFFQPCSSSNFNISEIVEVGCHAGFWANKNKESTKDLRRNVVKSSDNLNRNGLNLEVNLNRETENVQEGFADSQLDNCDLKKEVGSNESEESISNVVRNGDSKKHDIYGGIKESAGSSKGNIKGMVKSFEIEAERVAKEPSNGELKDCDGSQRKKTCSKELKKLKNGGNKLVKETDILNSGQEICQSYSDRDTRRDIADTLVTAMPKLSLSVQNEKKCCDTEDLPLKSCSTDIAVEGSNSDVHVSSTVELTPIVDSKTLYNHTYVAIEEGKVTAGKVISDSNASTPTDIDNRPFSSTDDQQTGKDVAVENGKSGAKKSKQKKKKKNSQRSPNNEKDDKTRLLSNSSSVSTDDGNKARKRPNKKQLVAIYEALKKAKDAEERLQKEEEAKRKMAEEAEKFVQEQQKLEQEKKEKKKLREKQKREKMKAEGRLLSKSQKQSRARMVATLEVLRQQGVDVPQIGEKRLKRTPMCNYSHRKRLDSSQSDSCFFGKSIERFKSESLSSQDSTSDFPSSFDSKDSWDLELVINGAQVTGSEEPYLNHNCSEESDVDKTINTVPKSVHFKLKQSKDASPECDKDISRLRSPVICVLGHVDTGKTKLLDYIRKTHVQDSEAGGITQQIGATMVPKDALKDKCKMVENFATFDVEVPGLLVIDTPGHESFGNLRSRGTSICDIAILVVDIMHGLEQQTLESINLLKSRKVPFVVALNKVDRLYGWKSSKDTDIRYILKSQCTNTMLEFKKRYQEVVLQLANLCLNAALFFENNDPRTYVSMVPVSAITGDGVGNLLSLITQLTQSMMYKQLTFTNELLATVLEVKVIPGLGTTIDVILINGRLQEGDTIVLAGHDGPIVTQIRSILMPQPLKELRVKNPYVEYKTVEGSQGVRVIGKDLDKAFAGMPLLATRNHNDVENLKARISDLLKGSIDAVKTSERGVYVQASTLGSLEALLNYLTSLDIPYFDVKIGPVVKKDVMKASIMLEHDRQYAAILAFDVKIERDAQELADNLGVKIFQANIIYHLFDAFLKHRTYSQKKREEVAHLAVFPCILRVLVARPQQQEFSVLVEAGSLRPGTPLCVSTQGNVSLGIVETVMAENGDPVFCAGEGREVTIRLVKDESQKSWELGAEDYFVSRVSRQSIEVCKEYFKDDLDSSDWHLMAELKKLLQPHV